MKNNIIRNRKSTRIYTKNVYVSDEEILSCIEAASRAPSSKNTQPWRFKIIRDADYIDQLSKVSKVNPWIKRVNSIVIVFRYGQEKDNVKDYLAIGAAIENFLLEAESNGIATCWIGSDDVIEHLKKTDFNDSCTPVALIAMGRGKSSQTIQTNRYNLDEIIL